MVSFVDLWSLLRIYGLFGGHIVSFADTLPLFVRKTFSPLNMQASFADLWSLLWIYGLFGGYVVSFADIFSLLVCT